jgi:uncharacterized protein (DUF2249 family)
LRAARRGAALAIALALVMAADARAIEESLPLNLTGNWCGQDKAAGSVLRVDQRRQEIEGSFAKSTKVLRFKGLLEGTRVKAAGGRLELEQLGDTIRVSVAQGNYAAWRGATFAKTCCGTCP